MTKTSSQPLRRNIDYPVMGYPENNFTPTATFIRETICTYVFVAVILTCKDKRSASAGTKDPLLQNFLCAMTLLAMLYASHGGALNPVITLWLKTLDNNF